MKLSNITCLCLNADVLTNKMSELLFILNSENPDIVVISEVLPKNCNRIIHKEEFTVPNYEMVPHPNIITNTGRGSLIYLKKNLTYKKIEVGSKKEKLDEFEESIILEINLNKTDRLVCASIYRREKSSDVNNMKLLKILEKLSELKCSHLAIMGDFNLRDINWNDYSCPGSTLEDYNHKFIECVRDCYLFQHILEPTRKRGNDTPHVLDLVFTNEENMVKDLEYLAPLGRSDHSILKFNIPCQKETTPPKIKVCYEKGDYKSLNDNLNNINWNEKLDMFKGDINKQWETFKNIFYEEEKKFVPRKVVYVNGVKNKKLSTPLDKKTLSKIKQKNKLWSKSRKNLASLEEELKYNKIRNQVRKLTRQGKKLMEKKVAQNAKSNPKVFWNYTKSKLKTQSVIPDIVNPGTEQNPVYTKNDSEKAEVFLKYFSSVFTKETDIGEMPPFEAREYEEVLDNIEITKDTVFKKLKKLKTNKSPGPDSIHPRVLHDIADSISVPLTLLFKSSLQLQELPEEWKQANVSVIFKKGKKTLPQNYRPVSLTCIICKTMESIIRDSVISHMRKNKLLSTKQFGFLGGRSTTLQLLHVLNIWTEILDQGGCLDVVYCDFMKAFDKVPHKRLIYKTEKYGISGNVLGWIHSFLNNRTQRVIINNDPSSYAPVSSGIPQGSVLGPILFVLYINDLPEVVDKDSYVYLFADDTKLFRKINNDKDAEILQDDINRLIDWSNLWLLKFHPDKCVYMGIGYNNESIIEGKYQMDGHSLNLSDCEKDIGVYIDSKLYFETHINTQVNKANRNLAIARKTFEYMDEEIFKHIYKGLVRPHLEYAVPVWSPHLVKHIDIIENVQRRATKLVPGLSSKSYENRLRHLKIPTLAYRRVRGDMIQVFKLLQDKEGYDETLPQLLTKSDSTLRGHNKRLQTERYNKDIRKYSFNLRVCKLWNSLPMKLVNSKDVWAFEKGLDEHWKDQPLMFENHKAKIQLIDDEDFLYY